MSINAFFDPCFQSLLPFSFLQPFQKHGQIYAADITQVWKDLKRDHSNITFFRDNQVVNYASNPFSSKEDVSQFFNQLLGKHSKSTDHYKKFLLATCHQGGLLYTLESAIAAIVATQHSGIDSQSCYSIRSTYKHMDIQFIPQEKAFLITESMQFPELRNVADNTANHSGNTVSTNGKLQYRVAFKFQPSLSEPSIHITIEKLHIWSNDQVLRPLLDYKPTILEKIIDCLLTLLSCLGWKLYYNGDFLFKNGMQTYLQNRMPDNANAADNRAKLEKSFCEKWAFLGQATVSKFFNAKVPVPQPSSGSAQTQADDDWVYVNNPF